MVDRIIKVGIVGSRSRSSLRDKKIIKDAIERQLGRGRKLHVVSGGCRGPDRFAEEIAKELGLGMSTHPVDVSDDPSGLPVWVFAQRAYARNTLIAEECDVLIACWDKVSGGTKDTINKVSKLGKPVIIV